jgi:hypothetical protein
VCTPRQGGGDRAGAQRVRLLCLPQPRTRVCSAVVRVLGALWHLQLTRRDSSQQARSIQRNHLSE